MSEGYLYRGNDIDIETIDGGVSLYALEGGRVNQVEITSQADLEVLLSLLTTQLDQQYIAAAAARAKEEEVGC